MGNGLRLVWLIVLLSFFPILIDTIDRPGEKKKKKSPTILGNEEVFLV